MKGFIEIIRADYKTRDIVNIAHIVDISDNKIITDTIVNTHGGLQAFVINTAHPHKELVEILNKAVIE